MIMCALATWAYLIRRL